MGKDKKTNDGHAKSSRSSRPPRGPASQAHGHGHPNYDAGHGHPNYDDGYGHQNYDEGHGNAGGLRGNPQHDPFFHVPSQPSTTPRSRPANQEFDSPHGGGELGHAPSASLSSIGSGSTNSQSLYYPSTTTQSQVNLDAESSDLAGQMAHITLDPSYSQQQQQHWGGTSPVSAASMGPSSGYAPGSQAHSSTSYPYDPSADASAAGLMHGHVSSISPMQEQFHRGYGVAQHHQDDIDDEAYAQHQQSGGDELPIGEAAEFGQGDYGGGQHHPDDLNAQLLFNPGGEMPDAEASGYDRWGPGTSQAEVDSQVASAQHYHQAIDDDEAGPSGQGPPLPAPSLLKVHINARNKITRVTRYRHPDAIFPVLCQSVADRVHHSVERLRDRCPVFTENGKIAYSTKRTRLFCAEEDEYRELGDWHNVEFYIVSGLKERFDYNMLIPLQYDWGADEAQ